MLIASFNRNLLAAGFTLIELSIALVIIALLIGGVLVGKDLIRHAELRAQLSQIDRYRAAVNTFHTKYGGLPGDIASDKAAQFGMRARSGADGHGDDDDILEGCSATGNAQSANSIAGCETTLFWRDLSYAGLIEGRYTTATDALTQVSKVNLPTVFPPAAIGGGNYVTVDYGGTGGYALTNPVKRFGNYFEIAAIQSTNSSGVYTYKFTIAPRDAFAIDTKVDDGDPARGSVTTNSLHLNQTNSGTLMIQSYLGPAPADTCLLLTLPELTYNLDRAWADAPMCALVTWF